MDPTLVIQGIPWYVLHTHFPITRDGFGFGAEPGAQDPPKGHLLGDNYRDRHADQGWWRMYHYHHRADGNRGPQRRDRECMG